MNLNDYQDKARETAVYKRVSAQTKILYPALGLSNESGEVLGKLKKLLRGDFGEHGESLEEVFTHIPVDLWQDVVLELGDVLWYVAMLADDLGISLEQVASLNIAKLSARKAAQTLQGDGDYR